MAHSTKPFDFTTARDRAAQLDPRKPFLVGPVPLSYGTLLDRMARLGSFFASTALKQGSRLAIATADESAAIVLYLAAVCHGLTAVMIDPQAPAAEANNLLALAKAEGIFLDAQLHAAWQPIETTCTVLIRPTAPPSLFTRLLGRAPAEPEATLTYPALLASFPRFDAPEVLHSSLDAHILFTSGTTSQPKGVRISQGALANHLGTLSRQFGYSEASRILNVLPLHHADGMVQGAVVAFVHGATLFRPMPFSIQALPALLDAVHAERITHFVAVPTMLALTLRLTEGTEDCFASPDFQCVISTAAALEQALWEAFETRFRTRIANVYGLTETVAGSLFSGPDNHSHRPGTIGKPVDCSARVVDTGGHESPIGEPGELQLSGSHLMSGYCDAQAALHDGWFSTGDLAIRDGDGFFRIVGRRKTLIITGGLNLHPEEVSECLNTHPEVAESFVFGLPDPTWGERVVACVVATGMPPPAQEDLVQHLRARLTPFKVPGQFLFLEALPKGPVGKVLVDQVRSLFAEHGVKRQDETRQDLPRQVRTVAARCFRMPVTSLSPASGQGTTPGWDSLAHLDFMVNLEEAFGIHLTAADIIRISTLQEAEQVVQERMNG